DAVELSFAQRFVELILEVARHALHLGRPAPEAAENARQVLRADDDDRHDRDDQQLRPTDIEHLRNASGRQTRGPPGASPDLADFGRLDLAWIVDLVLERPRRSRRVFVGKPLLEAFYALGDIAHQVGNLAASEQENDDQDDDQPVPDAEGTHQRL